jgi:predicted transcriptional regulator
MNAPINHQVIEKDGQPLFVLVPYDEYQSMIEKDMDVTIPHDVVERHILEEVSLVRAWREYKKLSQQDVAKKMNISQSAYSQMEKPDANLRTATVKRIAAALEIKPEQLVI